MKTVVTTRLGAAQRLPPCRAFFRVANDFTVRFQRARKADSIVAFAILYVFLSLDWSRSAGQPPLDPAFCREIERESPSVFSLGWVVAVTVYGRTNGGWRASALVVPGG